MHQLMVTQKGMSNDRKENKNMLMFLIFLAVFYVGTGYVVGKINAKHRGDEKYIIDWVELLKWPKELISLN